MPHSTEAFTPLSSSRPITLHPTWPITLHPTWPILLDIKTEEDEAAVLDVIAHPVDYEGPIIENHVDDAVFEDEGQVLRRKPSIRILESKAKVKAKKDTVQALIEANRASASANLRNKLSGRRQTGRKAGGKNRIGLRVSNASGFSSTSTASETDFDTDPDNTDNTDVFETDDPDAEMDRIDRAFHRSMVNNDVPLERHEGHEGDVDVRQERVLDGVGVGLLEEDKAAAEAEERLFERVHVREQEWAQERARAQVQLHDQEARVRNWERGAGTRESASPRSGHRRKSRSRRRRKSRHRRRCKIRHRRKRKSRHKNGRKRTRGCMRKRARGGGP